MRAIESRSWSTAGMRWKTPAGSPSSTSPHPRLHRSRRPLPRGRRLLGDSLADGMNLTAQDITAHHATHRTGVLILSRHAGVAQHLGTAAV
ncbi:hypothetical protein E6W17_39570 [Streptomyces sp. A1547]|nr:hypothetical protein E6W17_39570 [Streptomyces sp. A1547]